MKFDFAIRHRKLVYSLVALIVIVGIVGLFKMNRDEFPTFNIKQGLVAAIYPGATAEQVKAQLAEPLENVLFSFPEVDRNALRSYSKDGICYIYADLTVPASRKDLVWSRIKLKLESAKLNLPAGVLAVVVLDDFSETSSLLIAMESEDKGYSEMKYYADNLCDRLRQIPTLARATVVGEQTEEIAVNLDLDRLSSYGVSPSSLLLQYQTSTLNTPNGTFNTDYANASIHVSNPVTSEQQIEDKIIFANPQGGILKLRDVASVQRRYRKPDSYVSYNGHTALVVNVSMRPDNNVVEFGKEVGRVLDEFSKTLPDSVRMSRITDQPKVVKHSIMGFLRDLLISMLVVILVMLLLFPIRSALIAGSGLPVCTAVTIAVMYITGMQLNTVTLGALIVVLGMIVDDSIITMDGYMGKLGREESNEESNEEAAASSTRQLFMPMFMATFAISAMFFPTQFLIHGYLGDFIRSFPWIISIALFCSLGYATMVVPSLEVKFITGAQKPRQSLTDRMQNKMFAWMQDIYDKGEKFCFDHPAITICGGLVSIALGVLMFLQVNIQMLPKATRDCFSVEISLNHNASIERTAELSDSLTRMLLRDSRVKSVTSFIGESAPRFHSTYSPSLPGPNVAQLIVNTTSNRATAEVLPCFEEKYEQWFPEALVHFKQLDYQGSGSVEIVLRGAPVDSLKPLADSLKTKMYAMTDLLKWVHSDVDDLKPAVEVDIKADEASRLGVNKTLLSLSLATMMDGCNIANIWEDDKKIPVNVYASNVEPDMTYEEMGSQLISTLRPGVSVPLNQVADINPGWNYEQLPRSSGEDAIGVYADMKFGKSQPAAMKEIKKFIRSEIEPRLPEGASVYYGGLDASNAMVFPEIAWSFLAAVLILFLFLLINFRKMKIAALTIVLSMLCLFGASLGLWVFGQDFTITAVLGLISLVGIIVRNGIIMFEHAEELRDFKGISVREAAFLAGQRRMRPIFLTSCTTALGVLPMIIDGDALWMPMGLVICFGTLLSIVLIVLIMPVSYWQLYKKEDKK